MKKLIKKEKFSQLLIKKTPRIYQDGDINWFLLTVFYLDAYMSFKRDEISVVIINIKILFLYFYLN